MKRARRSKAKDDKKAKVEQRAVAAGSPLNPALFAESTVAALKAEYGASFPFPHVVVPALCDPTRAQAIEVEARTGLKADFKETDLFKVARAPKINKERAVSAATSLAQIRGQAGPFFFAAGCRVPSLANILFFPLTMRAHIIACVVVVVVVPRRCTKRRTSAT